MPRSGSAAPMMADAAAESEEKMINAVPAEQNTSFSIASATGSEDSLPAAEERAEDADPLAAALPFTVTQITQDYHEERTLITYEGEENSLYLTEVPEAVWKRSNDSGAISLPCESDGMIRYGLTEKDGMVYVLEFAEPVPPETMEVLLELIRE